MTVFYPEECILHTGQNKINYCEIVIKTYYYYTYFADTSTTIFAVFLACNILNTNINYDYACIL